jgi:hypothetical protein
MKKGPSENNLISRSLAYAAIVSVLSGCGLSEQNEIIKEDDRNPPAGAPDDAQFTKADIKPNTPEKKNCSGMKIVRNADGGIKELDFTNDGSNCP